MKDIEVMRNKENKPMTTFTSRFWHTKETANKSANNMTKIKGCYYTTVKGEPHDRQIPNECWAVTNRFDPRIKEYI